MTLFTSTSGVPQTQREASTTCAMWCQRRLSWSNCGDSRSSRRSRADGGRAVPPPGARARLPFSTRCRSSSSSGRALSGCTTPRGSPARRRFLDDPLGVRKTHGERDLDENGLAAFEREQRRLRMGLARRRQNDDIDRVVGERLLKRGRPAGESAAPWRTRRLLRGAARRGCAGLRPCLRARSRAMHPSSRGRRCRRSRGALAA